MFVLAENLRGLFSLHLERAESRMPDTCPY